MPSPRPIRYFVCWLSLLFLVSGATATTYTYDALGRLQTATDSVGDTAEYVYDAVGNITEVRRYAATSLAVTNVFPVSGPVGTVVTLQGAGFSDVPGNNTVTFNGAGAVVSAATSGLLTVTVPTGATSGPIQVVVGSRTAAAPGTFDVTANDGSPTIATLSHTCIAEGQAVTVTGTNFDTAAQATRVDVGSRFARILSISPATLTFAAPQRTAGGAVRVMTRRGTAISTQTIRITGAGLPCAKIEGPIRLQVDGPPATQTIPTGQTLSIAVEGVRGQWLTLHASDMTSVSGFRYLGLTIRTPNTAPMQDFLPRAALSPDYNMSVHLPPLPVSGTYTFELISSSTTTTVTLAVVTATPATIDGPSTALYAKPAQSQRLIFDATAGSTIGIGAGPMSLTPTNVTVSLNVYDRDLVRLPPASPFAGCGKTCNVDIASFNRTGIHTLTWTPSTNATAPSSGFMVLTSDFRAALTRETTQAVGLPRYGQNARLRFQANAGESLGLLISNLQLTQPDYRLWLQIIRPDGTVLGASSVQETYVTMPGKMVNLYNLPMAGTYEVYLDPEGGVPTSASVSLMEGTNIAINGAEVPLATTEVGHSYRLYFDGQAGQKLGLGLLGLSVTPTSLDKRFTVEIRTAAGVPLGDGGVCIQYAGMPGCEIDIGALPYTGRYSITIRPQDAVTASSLRVLLTEDLYKVLSSSDNVVSIGRNGGNARMYFNAEPGQAQTITISNVATTPSAYTRFTVLRPDGRTLIAPLYQSIDVSTGNGTMRIGDFPLRGQYTLFVDPGYAVLADYKARITSSVEVIEGGVPVTRSVVPGPWHRIDIALAGTGYQSVAVDSLAYAAGRTGASFLSIYGPDGTAMLDGGQWQNPCNVSDGGCDFDLLDPIAPGNYQALLDLPFSLRTDASLQWQVSAAQVVQGNAGTFALQPRGTNGRLNFDVTQNEVVKVTVARIAPATTGENVAVRVLSPLGAELVNSSLPSHLATTSFTLPAAVITGSYAVLIDPDFGKPGNVTVTVTRP